MVVPSLTGVLMSRDGRPGEAPGADGRPREQPRPHLDLGLRPPESGDAVAAAGARGLVTAAAANRARPVGPRAVLAAGIAG